MDNRHSGKTEGAEKKSRDGKAKSSVVGARSDMKNSSGSAGKTAEKAAGRNSANAMGRKIRKNVLYIAAAVLAVSLVLAIGVFAVRTIYNPVTTELAYNYSEDETVTANGLIFRDETLVNFSGSGTLDYLVRDGDRVAEGGLIAGAYADAESVAAENEIRRLNTQLETLKSISKAGNVYVLGVDQINQQIMTAIYSIASTHGNSGASSAIQKGHDLNDLITKKQVATGTDVDFSGKIKDIEDEITKLEKSITKRQSSVYAANSGYFYAECDGYEGVVDISSVGKMTISQFEAVRPNEVSDLSIGKIAGSYIWYYVFKTDSDTAKRLKTGSDIYARFTLAGTQKFKVRVSSVNYEGENALVVLEGDYAAADMSLGRDQPLEIILNSYTGLRVDERAIRIVDGVTGVYVRVGYQVKFKKIDIIFTTDEYVLSKVSESDSGLQLYDSIIIKGGNLYDGKLLS